MRGYNTQQVNEYIARCTSQIRDLEARLAHALDESEHLRREISVVRQQALSGRPAHEEVSERISQILRLAEDEAKAQKGKADKEISDLRAEAQRESDLVRTDAREQAERMLTAAQEQAERTIAAARSEADGLHASTHSDAERLTSESRQQADAIISDARAKAKRIVDEASARAAAVHDGAERRLSLLSTRHGETVRRLSDILEGVQGLMAAESSRKSLEDEVNQAASAAIAALEPVKRTENAGPAALGSAPGDRGQAAPGPAPSSASAPQSAPPAPTAPAPSPASSGPAAPAPPPAPSAPPAPPAASTASAPAPGHSPAARDDNEATVPVPDSTVPLPGTAAHLYRSISPDNETTLPVSGRTIPPSATSASAVGSSNDSSSDGIHHDDADTGPMPLGGPLGLSRTSTGSAAPVQPGNDPLGYSRDSSEPSSSASSSNGSAPPANGSGPDALSGDGLPRRAPRNAEEAKDSEGHVVRSTASPGHAQLPTAAGRHATSKPTATAMPAAAPSADATAPASVDTSQAPPAMPRRLGGHSIASPRNSLPVPSGLPLPGEPAAGSGEAGDSESQLDSNGHRRIPNPPGFPAG